jgi:hypothetical protein
LRSWKSIAYSQFFGGEYVSDPSSSASLIHDESQDNADVYAQEVWRTVSRFSKKDDWESVAAFRMKFYRWSDPRMIASESDELQSGIPSPPWFEKGSSKESNEIH